MKKIHTEIIIKAPVTKVWSTLLDFDSYTNWNPFIIKLQGHAIIGSKLEVTLKFSDKKMMVFTPTVVECEEHKVFAWKGKFIMPGVFDGKHSFRLEAIDDGQTKLIHAENFSGLLSPVIFPMIDRQTQAGFECMNIALKERAM